MVTINLGTIHLLDDQTTLTGFLLTGDFEDHNNQFYLRFFGTNQDGPFEVILTDQHPQCYLQGQAQPNLPRSYRRESTELMNFNRQPVDKITFPNWREACAAKDRFKRAGVTTYESDLKPAEKYLMDRGIYAQVRLKNPKLIRQRPGLVQWIDPVMEPITDIPDQPELSMLSLDIETGKQGQLFSIALHYVNPSKDIETKIAMICKDPKSVPAIDDMEVLCFHHEEPMLRAFLKAVQDLDPDLLIGWNVVGFDFDFLLKKMKAYRVEPILGRNQTKLRLYRSGMGMAASVHGRVIVDVPKSLRLNFFSFERFGLDYVAKDVLGNGKLITGSKGKWEEIERQYYEEPDALLRYNMQDSVLVTRITQKTGIVDLLKKRSIISGMLIPRVGGSTAAFDHQMIPALHKAGFVVPELADIEYNQTSKGGHVFLPDAGIHQHVVVLDFRSLYPSIIKTFNMDPLAILRRDDGAVNTPVNISFSSKHHALPEIIDRLLQERKHAKASGDAHLSQAIKILMNSFYGVMGSGGCRFYHEDLPNAITGVGRYILEASKTFLEDDGYSVIYGDTDSVFVCLKPEETQDYAAAGEAIANTLNTFFREKIKLEYGLESHLDMEYEKYYRHFFLPPMRSPLKADAKKASSATVKGSKKRYAGMMSQGDGAEDKLVFTGMEYVRSDWTKCAKNFQWHLYLKLFQDQPIDDWLRNWVEDLKKGAFDTDLVYQKRLTKPAHEYTKTKPPHVKAALKILQKDPKSERRHIRYVMTADGPEPEEHGPLTLDYTHYIDKQLKPIAETILPFFSKDWDEIVGGKGMLF